MYLVATGEPPFKDRQFDGDLICDIMSGLRPSMPDPAPEEYKKPAERCCDADPDKRPDARTLRRDIYMPCLLKRQPMMNLTAATYHNDVTLVTSQERE